VAPTDQLDTPTLEAAVRLLAESLDRHRGELNRLNVYPVPDGDTGNNLVATLASVTARLPGDSERSSVVEAICTGSLLGGRGSSGVILGQALRELVKALPENSDGAGLATGLEAAAAGARKAVADPVEGTILTVADDAARAARSAAAESGSLAAVAQAAGAEGRRSLARTPSLLPALARAGVVDAGGLGYVLLLDSLSQAVTGKGSATPPLELPAPVLATGVTREAPAAEPAQSGRFEVLCLLKAAAERVDLLREQWLALGDTVAFAGGGGTWRGHVHTDAIGRALAAVEQAGTIVEVEITDLAERGAEEYGLRPAGGATGVPSVVAVAEGDGLVAAYLEAGAQRVVVGGVTAKPATGELLRVVDACSGPVVLLAGDKDVVPAARQAAELAAEPVAVVPTDMVSGLLVLEEFGPLRDRDASSAAARLERAAGHLRAVRIQQAVRDSRTELGTVRAGEWLAMGRSHPVAIGPTAEETLDAAAETLVTPASTTGVLALDQQTSHASEVLDRLRGAHPHLDWQVRRTNRPSCAYGLVVR
jgi:DAK2 domain fusion protein YloV